MDSIEFITAGQDSSPRPRNNEIKEEASYLNLLQKFLHTPCLSLLEVYLIRSTLKNRNAESIIAAFRIKHWIVFKLFFIADLFFRLFIIFVVIHIVLRGLGIIDLSEVVSNLIGKNDCMLYDKNIDIIKFKR